MPAEATIDIARMMLRRHGLQAQAVSLERIRESRLAGDTAGLDRWQQVLAVIEDRRRTAGRPANRAGADKAGAGWAD